MIRENTLKKRLRDGENVIGTFVRANDPAVVEVLGRCGFDFIIIDNEHTAMNRGDMVNLIRCAELWRMAPVVRVCSGSAQEILQALDAGALGVQVPQVDTPSQAAAIVGWAKYAPLGARGFASTQRAAGYGALDGAAYSRLSNEQTMVVCYCETRAAVDNLERTAALPGIDVIFIGPNDLSQAYGVIGEIHHPVVEERIDYIIKTVRSAGKAAGIIAADGEEARRWNERGAQFISMSSDLGMLASCAGDMLGRYRRP